MNEEHRKAFLEKFADEKHNLITQMFCYAVRGGAKTVSEILSRVDADAKRRFADPYTDDEARDTQRRLLAELFTQEAKDFANFIFWRESLPKEERLKMKYARSKQYASEAMSKQPPTEKQIKYLQGLGCDIAPTSKKHASELIEKFK